MKTLKTDQYDIFKFREDNREKIDHAHVRDLCESIESRNLLELRPIMVNSEMEVLDGQHRLLAAKKLGVHIYYQVDDALNASDIIIMNVAKRWTLGDYLNFYTKQQYDEYIKLKNFMKKNNLSLKIAVLLTMKSGRLEWKKFRDGTYVFPNEDIDVNLDICWDTIEYIKRMNGFSSYTDSGKFWKALLKLIKHENFNAIMWRKNLEKMIERFKPKARTEDYLAMFMEVHNFYNKDKVRLYDEV